MRRMTPAAACSPPCTAISPKHVKLGAGYNFTDFSDDLTDLSYRSRGPFINIMSTF
jgi:hypothetical protein